MLLPQSSRKKLKKINQHDFGEYLALVESYVFEIESLAERGNKEVTEIRSKVIRNAILLILGLLASTGLPLILLYMASIIETSVFEKIVYVIWALAGVKLSMVLIKKHKHLNQQANFIKKDVLHAFAAGIQYCSNVINAYFLKSENIENNFQGMEEQQFKHVQSGLLRIEMDLDLFTEIAYKYNKLNQDTLILAKDRYTNGREEARLYLAEYLKSKTIKPH